MVGLSDHLFSRQNSFYMRKYWCDFAQINDQLLQVAMHLLKTYTT